MSFRLFAITALNAFTLTALVMSSAASAQDSESSSLKQRYLNALTLGANYDDPDYIGHDFDNPILWPPANRHFSEVMWSLTDKTLRDDPDIRRALLGIQETYPVISTSAVALVVLSPRSDAQLMASIPEIQTIHDQRHRCTAQSVGAKALLIPPHDVTDKLTPRQQVIKITDGQENRTVQKISDITISAAKVSDGWVAGYGKALGLGLHFVPDDDADEAQKLMDGTIHAIIKNTKSDSYLVLSTDDDDYMLKQCHKPLKVSELKETISGQFDIRPSRTLPNRVKYVGQMDNGDVFIEFGAGCRMGSMPMEPIEATVNPPIGLTPAGEIYAVCEAPPRNKRWR